MSVDVEEYFHASEIQEFARDKQHSTFPSRVSAQVDRVLETFGAHDVKATFFILGVVAERHPALVRKIAAEGHEVGCHSYAHRLVYDLTPEQFRQDTKRAIECIEQACGQRPRVYRAPSYSIVTESLWALEILAEFGFSHDSSVYPIHHDRYGIPGFNRAAQIVATPAGPIYEVPVATVQLAPGQIAPIGGGGYLRLLPYRYTAAGIRRINKREQMPACIYFHPWEIDPEQPRIASGMISRLRTYSGLSAMESKIKRLLTEFRFSMLTSVFPSNIAPKAACAALGCTARC